MADEQSQQVEQEKEPVLRQPDEAVKDLEPDQDEAESVKGGLKLDYKE
jgi:hypothetical protein